MARLSILCAAIAIGLIAHVQADLYCFDDVKAECASQTYNPVCTTTFNNFPKVVSKFQLYANTHALRSAQALMLSKHFSNYQVMRPGFHCMFSNIADALFDQFVAMIRYINNRGLTHDFSKCASHDETHGNFELYELESLSYIADVEKKLAQDALDLDLIVGGSDPRFHDGDASYHLQRKYSVRHRDNVRKYAGFYVMLERMLSSKNQMLALYDFDEYLSTMYGFYKVW